MNTSTALVAIPDAYRDIVRYEYIEALKHAINLPDALEHVEQTYGAEWAKLIADMDRELVRRINLGIDVEYNRATRIYLLVLEDWELRDIACDLGILQPRNYVDPSDYSDYGEINEDLHGYEVETQLRSEYAAEQKLESELDDIYGPDWAYDDLSPEDKRRWAKYTPAVSDKTNWNSDDLPF